MISSQVRLIFAKKNHPQNRTAAINKSKIKNRTHGGAYLVLLPSGPDTIRRPAIVLAFRQKLVYQKINGLPIPNFQFLLLAASQSLFAADLPAGVF